MPAARTRVSNGSIRPRNPGWTRCFALHHALPVPPWPPPFARRPATQPAPVPPAQGNHAANACSPLLLIRPVFSRAIGALLTPVACAFGRDKMPDCEKSDLVAGYPGAIG